MNARLDVYGHSHGGKPVEQAVKRTEGAEKAAERAVYPQHRHEQGHDPEKFRILHGNDQIVDAALKQRRQK